MDRVRNVSGDLRGKNAGSGLRVARLPKENTTNKQERDSARKGKIREAKKTGYVNGLKYEVFESVWDALGLSPQEAANLDARSALMMQIEGIIKRRKWTQAMAAKHCGVSQPRINDLLRGKIDKFSLDALVNIAASLDQRVKIELIAA